jgi:uncharacterized protein (UPF0276 family)
VAVRAVVEEVAAAEAAGVVDAVAANVDWAALPTLGVGLGFRPIHRSEIFLYRDQIHFLEVTADHYFDTVAEKDNELRLLAKNFAIIPHGLAMSLGSAEGLDAEYVAEFTNVVDIVQPAWCSDHIAFTRAGGLEIGHLTPIPRTKASLRVLDRNIAVLKQSVSVPIILENITETILFPGEALEQAEFLTELCEQSDVGLLLDVTNLFINSVNHRYDPIAVLHGLPRERIVQLHFVGGQLRDGVWIDSHGDETNEEVWQLLEEVLKYAPVKGMILERDENIPPLAQLIPEISRATQLGIKYGRWAAVHD